MPVTAGTTYVASYHTDAGHYAITPSGLASAVTNGPLTALASGGVYAYGSGERLPLEQLQRVELLGRRGVHAVGGSTPPAVTTVTPSDGSTGNRGVGGADGDVLAGGGAEYGVVHGEGLRRERRWPGR